MKNTHILAHSHDKREEADWNCPGLWLVSHNCLSACPGPCQAPFPAPLALRHSSPPEPGLPQLRRVHSCGGGSWLEPNPGFLLQLQGGVGHWAEEKLPLTPGFGSSSSISSPNPYKVDSCQHVLGKDMTYVHTRSNSPVKSTGNTQTV